jgi:hypothetical protein
MEKKMSAEKENGSVLVLTIISVLILSIMVTGLLNVGSTEIYTTQNFHLNKSAYYLAVQGVEEIRTLIYNTPNAESVSSIVKVPPGEAYSNPGGYLSFYTTGSLKDLEDMLETSNTTGVPVEQFKGFTPPSLMGISMGGSSSVEPIVWKVRVTAKIDANKRSTYSEITAGIYSVLTVGY